MRKAEFLQELENALSGRLSPEEVAEVLADYQDIFSAALADGKSEEEAAAEIGSPASICRTILEEETPIPLTKPDVSNLASMGRRLAAQVIDYLLVAVVGVVLLMGVTLVAGVAYSDSSYTEILSTDRPYLQVVLQNEAGQTTRVLLLSGKEVVFDGTMQEYSDFRKTNRESIPSNAIERMDPIREKNWERSQEMEKKRARSQFGTILASHTVTLTLLCVLGFPNLILSVFLWLGNGSTLGKRIMGIRVEQLDGGKLTFWTAFLREGLVKGILSGFTGGLLNAGSFVWGCATPEHKTVQDLAARTRVVNR